MIAQFLFEIAVDAFERIVGLWDQGIDQKDKEWTVVVG